MTLHVPTHPAGFTGQHHLGYVLLPIVAIVLGLGMWAAAILVQPHVTVTVQPSEQQLYNEFRAGERASWALPYTGAQQLYYEYRAGERGSWTVPYTGAQQLYNQFRVGERGSWAASYADPQQLFLDYRAGERDSWGSQ